MLRDNGYEIAPFLTTIFLSEDFHSEPSIATHIKSPTELIVSTYRKLGLTELPGIPDPYTVSKTLGQILLYPPTVAGWAGAARGSPRASCSSAPISPAK